MVPHIFLQNKLTEYKRPILRCTNYDKYSFTLTQKLQDYESRINKKNQSLSVQEKNSAKPVSQSKCAQNFLGLMWTDGIYWKK